jgi:hypothetical protein
MTLPEPVREAIAVFDKSAERTRPNEQTAAWAVLRDHIATLTAERDALAQRCAAAERDAARYRWLRDVAPSLSRGPMLAFCTGPDRADEITALDDADAAIDAAIHQETP